MCRWANIMFVTRIAVVGGLICGWHVHRSYAGPLAIVVADQTRGQILLCGCRMGLSQNFRSFPVPCLCISLSCIQYQD